MQQVSDAFNGSAAIATAPLMDAVSRDANSLYIANILYFDI